MFWFLGGIILLIVGYFTYGRFVERILEPDDRETPAKKFCDGVDFVVIPNWKNMLIQLLNIAGVGPVIGVILGIKFGAVVFLIIPVGNIIGGAVHDFVSGMMSIRHGGANLPKLIRITLGKPYYAFFSVFMCFLLLLGLGQLAQMLEQCLQVLRIGQMHDHGSNQHALLRIHF